MILKANAPPNYTGGFNGASLLPPLIIHETND